MSNVVDQVTQSGYHYVEFELNRLAGTLVNALPTLGASTAALWWWGHRELNWAFENLLTPNQATGGASLETPEGFAALYNETLEVVDGSGVIGDKVLKITAAPDLPAVEPLSPAALYTTERIPVEPWHIYTLSAYVRSEQNTKRGTHLQFVWFTAEGEMIGPTEGGLWSSKPDVWTHMWITAPAPENAAFVQVILQWDTVLPGESFSTDKWILHNSSDVQAWALPGHAAVDRALGLYAHLNMKAGIYNPDNFLPLVEICNRLAGREGQSESVEDALARIPTPNPLVVEH